MVKVLKPKTKRIIKAKLKGKSNSEIAATEYPNATPESGVVLVSKQLNKPQVKQIVEDLKLKALEDNDITWDKNIKIMKQAQKATKVVMPRESPDYEIPDYNVRLKATIELNKLLDSKPLKEESKNEVSEELLKAIQSGKVDQINQVIFKGNDNQPS